MQERYIRSLKLHNHRRSREEITQQKNVVNAMFLTQQNQMMQRPENLSTLQNVKQFQNQSIQQCPQTPIVVSNFNGPFSQQKIKQQVYQTQNYWYQNDQKNMQEAKIKIDDKSLAQTNSQTSVVKQSMNTYYYDDISQILNQENQGVADGSPNQNVRKVHDQNIQYWQTQTQNSIQDVPQMLKLKIISQNSSVLDKGTSNGTSPKMSSNLGKPSFQKVETSKVYHKRQEQSALSSQKNDEKKSRQSNYNNKAKSKQQKLRKNSPAFSDNNERDVYSSSGSKKKKRKQRNESQFDENSNSISSQQKQNEQLNHYIIQGPPEEINNYSGGYTANNIKDSGQNQNINFNKIPFQNQQNEFQIPSDLNYLKQQFPEVLINDQRQKLNPFKASNIKIENNPEFENVTLTGNLNLQRLSNTRTGFLKQRIESQKYNASNNTFQLQKNLNKRGMTPLCLQNTFKFPINQNPYQIYEQTQSENKSLKDTIFYQKLQNNHALFIDSIIQKNEKDQIEIKGNFLYVQKKQSETQSVKNSQKTKSDYQTSHQTDFKKEEIFIGDLLPDQFKKKDTSNIFRPKTQNLFNLKQNGIENQTLYENMVPKSPIQNALQQSKLYLRLKNKLKKQNEENVIELSNQTDGKHSSEALTSTGIKTNVLSNEETLYKYSRVSQNTMLQTKNHPIFKNMLGFNSFNQQKHIVQKHEKVKTVEDDQKKVIIQQNEEQQEDFNSPYTDELNLYMIANEMNIDMNGTQIRSNQFQTFLRQINFLFNQKPASEHKDSKSILSNHNGFNAMTSSQILQNIKNQNNKIFNATSTRISRLIQLNFQNQIKTVQPLVLHPINIGKVSAVFLKIQIHCMKTPLKLTFKNHLSRIFLNQKQKYIENDQENNFCVYWSYTNPFPCDGNQEFDGIFNNNESFLSIQPYGENLFSQNNIFIGIYTRNGFQDQLIYQYGKSSEKQLVQMIQKQNFGEQEKVTKKFVEKEKKTFNVTQKLKEFQNDTNKNIKIFVKDIEKRSEYNRILQDSIQRMKNKGLLAKGVNISLDVNDSDDEAKKQKNKMKIKNTDEQKKSDQAKVKEDQIQKIEEHKRITFENLHKDSSRISQAGKVEITSTDELYQTQDNFQFSLSNENQIQMFKESFQEDMKKQKSIFYKEMQMQEIKRLEIQRYKFCIFMTIKHDLIKQIKEQKLDELIAVLRKRKFARIYVKTQKLQKVIQNFWKNILFQRTKKEKNNLKHLRILRFQLKFKKFLKKKYGSIGAQNILKSLVKPLFKFVGKPLIKTVYDRALQLIKIFLLNDNQMKQQKLRFQKYFSKIITLQRKVRIFQKSKKIQIFKILNEMEGCFKMIKDQILKLKVNIRKSYEFIVTEILQIQKERSQIDEALFPNSSIHIANQFELYLNGIYMMDWYRQKLIHQEFNQNPGKIKEVLIEFINLKLNKVTVKQIILQMQAKNIKTWNIFRVLKPFFDKVLDEQSIDLIHQFYMKKNIKSKEFQKYLNQFRNARIALFEPYIEKLLNYPTTISENNKAFIQKMMRKNTKRKLTMESPEKEKEEIAEADTLKSQATSVSKAKPQKGKKGKNKKNNIYQIDQGIIFEEEGEKDLSCTFEMIDKYYADSSIPMVDLDPLQVFRFDIDEILAVSRYQPANMPNNNDIQSEVEQIEQIDQSSKERLAQLKNLWNLNCLELAYKSLIFYSDGKNDPFAETLEFNTEDPFKIS